MKTNAMRMLDTLGIRYEIREYEVDADDLSAERVAGDIGLPAEQVFKTLVARGDRQGVLLAVVPANAEVDFKALARQSNNRTVELVSLKEVQPLTGYVRGGVTALAGKRDYPVYVDEQIELFDVVAVSAGVRGKQMLLAPADYLLRHGRALGLSVGREESDGVGEGGCGLRRRTTHVQPNHGDRPVLASGRRHLGVR